MASFHEIFGQARPIKILQSILQTGNVPTALLFAGEEGIGKRSAAMIFIQTLLCEAGGTASSDNSRPVGSSGAEQGGVGDLDRSDLASECERKGATRAPIINPCGRCLSCKKVQSGNHPDFLAVAPLADEHTIKIDSIRSMQDTLVFEPIDAKYKIVLITQAEALTMQAQNSLLKTLEEAPQYAVLILIACKPLLLAPTLLSRCQKVPFSPLSLSQIEAILMEKKQWPITDARLVAAYTGGNLGEALSLNVEEARAKEEVLNGLVQDVNLSHYDTLFDLAKSHAGTIESMGRALSYLAAYFRDILVMHAVSECSDSLAQIDQHHSLREGCDPSLLVFSWRREELIRWANRMTAEEATRFLADIAAIWQTLSRNINKQLALETLLMQMRDKL
jgi:DNA polymerase-3 subunit delta'